MIKKLNKKLLLATFLLVSTQSVMADYLAGYMSCQNNKSGKEFGYTYFIVKGIGKTGDKSAMEDFLNAEYAGVTYRHCRHKKIYGTKALISTYKSKAKANKKFSHLISDFKNEDFVKKIVTVSRGYDESDWK